MASLTKRLFPSVIKLNSKTVVNCKIFARTMIYDKSGAILEKPDITKFGVIKVLAMVLPFLYIGGVFAKKTAAILEDYELFVPDDDDD